MPRSLPLILLNLGNLEISRATNRKKKRNLTKAQNNQDGDMQDREYLGKRGRVVGGNGLTIHRNSRNHGNKKTKDEKEKDKPVGYI